MIKRLFRFFSKNDIQVNSEDTNTIKEFEDVFEQNRIFWSEKYPSLSIEEKKKIWEEDIYRSIRTQGEALGDEYTAFSKKWYDSAKEREPQFDEFFKEIVENLEKGYFYKKFNWDEYRNRIGQ